MDADELEAQIQQAYALVKQIQEQIDAEEVPPPPLVQASIEVKRRLNQLVDFAIKQEKKRAQRNSKVDAEMQTLPPDQEEQAIQTTIAIADQSI